MISIRTPLTQALGIQTPIISAAMAGASGGALAAAVSLAGGFGFLASGYEPLEAFHSQLSTARDLLKAGTGNPLPIGAGFLVWMLEKDPCKGEEMISTAIANRVKAIWLSFGEDVGRWVKYIRENDPYTNTKDAVNIFVQLSTLHDISVAMNEWNVEVIVVQGNEAGGHGIGTSLPLATLLPLVISATSSSVHQPFIVAAGGVATGAQIASLLTLGASGVVLGSRFLLSPESLYSDAQKASLLAADSSMSVRSMAFDYVRNTLGWPKGVDGRGLRNDTVKDFENGVDIEILQQRFASSAEIGDNSRSVIWAGSGVGLMKDIAPAQDIVKSLHEECLQRLQAVSQLIK